MNNFVFIFLLILAYIAFVFLNLFLSGIVMLIKYGKKPDVITAEQHVDMDRCSVFMFLGPLGTLLIISNIILNIINKF